MARGDVFAGGGTVGSSATMTVQPAAGTEVLLLFFQASYTIGNPAQTVTKEFSMVGGAARLRGVGSGGGGAQGTPLKLPITNTYYPTVSGSGNTLRASYSGVQMK